MKEVNVDLRFVRHNDLHQLPVDRGIVRGLLEDGLKDGGDVVLRYGVCSGPIFYVNANDSLMITLQVLSTLSLRMKGRI